MTTLIVNEIFLSINGETSSIGMPTVFIRLSGCNLDCWGGCDTTYALKREDGLEMTLEEIIEQVEGYGCPRVCLTGGEPLLDGKKSYVLLEKLSDLGYEDISVETNGSIDLGLFKEKFPQIRFTMDLKPPSSGMAGLMVLSNIKFLTELDEIKFVIADKDDFQWSNNILSQYLPKAKILYSPMYERLEPAQLVEWVLEAKLWQARVQLQIHKYIWSPSEKGV